MPSNYENSEQAELDRIRSEVEKNNAEKERIYLEIEEAKRKASKKWWDIKATGFIQATIGGVVAGFLVGGFVLDHFLKINDLNEKQKVAIEANAESLKIQNNELTDRLQLSEFRNRELDVDKKRSEEVLSWLEKQNQELLAQLEKNTQQVTELKNQLDGQQNIQIAQKREAFEEQLKALEIERAKSKEREQVIAQQKVKIFSGGDGTSFPLIASIRNKERAIELARKVEKIEDLKYKPSVYLAENGWYVVSLGGHLIKKEAQRRVNYARDSEIANDAFVWTSEFIEEPIYP